ncbi:MAG: site-specific DNA-methyltransferase [Candidatus Lokiarchaeota archaeon]|nr:site-specific DNA-methyltransferase [Candidatus Lokiarchaeota archaeon]
MSNSEEKFFDALKQVYVGIEIKSGKSAYGFVNLLRIKKHYFDFISKKLKEDIETEILDFPNFKEELYDKLLSFFKHYFTQSGSIYLYDTPYSDNIYDKVYSNKEDVSLFWKTHMLYYVKSDRIFNDMDVQIYGITFSFDASKLEYKEANEKRDIIILLNEIKPNNKIIFEVNYSERGKKTNIAEIKKELKKNGIKLTSEDIIQAEIAFKKQTEVDYFINKDARSFLKEQFDFWHHRYIFSDESEFDEKRIKQLKMLKKFAYKIIDAIAEFEDELVRIWKKPRFVFNSNYVITLNKIASKTSGNLLIKKIVNHDNFTLQIDEWRELKLISEGFTSKELFNGSILNEKYEFLPIDTKYFENLKMEILSLFKNLDNELDGWLIKSENFQALNTILPKFERKVRTIYIDPPFNKETEADYFYSVKFKNATWLTILENRLSLASELLTNNGSIFVKCDNRGNMFVRLLMDEIFGSENFKNEIIVERTKAKQKIEGRFITQNESLFFYAKGMNNIFYDIERPIDAKWYPLLHFPRPDEKPRTILGKQYYPPINRRWALSQERISAMENKKKIRINESLKYTDCLGNEIYGMPEILYDSKEVGNIWFDIPVYAQKEHFPTENSEELLERVIISSTDEGDIIMDFFLGSGTTIATAQKLKRRWIGIEMGKHFYDIILPRMKLTLAGHVSGISKKKKVYKGGFFKYYKLEQYEQTLSKATYNDSSPIQKYDEDIYNQYLFLNDLKLLKTLDIDYKQNNIKLNLSKVYDNIDIAETYSNLKGIWIKSISRDFVEFENCEKLDFTNLDYKSFKPLIWWGK